MSDNAIIVGNTRAGQAGDAPALMRELAGRLAAAGTETTTLPFPEVAAEPGWRRRLDDLLDAGAKRLYVFGGDGTVRTLATRVLGRDVALGIVALGTANLLARDLGLPLTPADAVAALGQGADVRRIDVARCNGRPFLCAAMFGMTTQLARTREAARGVGTWRILPRLLRKAYWVLRSYPFQRVRLHLDDAPLTLTTRALVVTNNPLAPRPGLYPARPVLDGAELGVYGVTEGPLYELPRLAMSLISGTWGEEPRVFQRTCRRARILTSRLLSTTALLDGERERFGTPLEFDLLPRALPVLVPADS
jgi:diacylglycerol kinase family enzyme